MTILTFVWLRWGWEGEQRLHQPLLSWPGPGEAGGPACQEDTQGGQASEARERERAAVSATSTVSQCGEAERQTECHDPQRHSVTRPSLSRSHHTLGSLCHA